MIKTVLKSLRTFVQSALAETFIAETAFQQCRTQDAWLFEDTRSTHSLDALPAYPAQDCLTEGELHRLSLIDAAVSAMKAELEQIRTLSASVLSVASRVTVDREKTVENYMAVAFGNAVSKRLVDPVVTDILFDHAFGQNELNSDLFELNDPHWISAAPPAYQIRSAVRKSEVEANYSSRSGG